MTSIGFRCRPDAVFYTVLDGTRASPTLVHSGVARVPTGMSRIDALAWFRREIHVLLTNYNPDSGGFKAIEANALKRGNHTDRIEFEGVLQEACAAHSQHLHLARMYWASIKGRVGWAGKASEAADALPTAIAPNNKTTEPREASITALASLDA